MNEALALALRLSPRDRIRLIEHIASSLEREIEPETDADEHWGKALNALLDQLDMSEWEAPAYADPEEWLRVQRAKEQKRRLGDWGQS